MASLYRGRKITQLYWESEILVAKGQKKKGQNTCPFFMNMCGRGDSNSQVLADTTTSTLRVYQFRHLRRGHGRQI